MNTRTRKAIPIVLGFVLLGLFSVIPLKAQTATEDDNPLNKIAWLVGGTWVAEINNPDGSQTTVESTFNWASHKRLIHFRTVFKTGGEAIPRYEGIYGWHPREKKLAFWYTDYQGRLTTGFATGDGNTLEHEFQIFYLDGTIRKFRSTVRRLGEDIFAWAVFAPQDGDWVEAASLTYKRQE